MDYRRPRELTGIKELARWLNSFGEWHGEHFLVPKDFRKTVTWNGKSRTIARIKYEAMHGEIPKGLLTRHDPSCEKELGDEHWRCIRTSHLKVGTYHDNFMDAVETGRATPAYSGIARPPYPCKAPKKVAVELH